MKQVDWIKAPYAVYTTAYDAAGRLWFGGGWWYGGGFVAVAERGADAAGGVRWYRGVEGGWLEEPGADATEGKASWWPLAVSGLWLTANARHLVLSMWAYRQHAHPVRILELADRGPRHVLDRATVGDDDSDAIATGVIVHRGHVLVRQLSRAPEVALAGFAAPELGPPERADVAAPAVLASRRLVALDGAVVSGWGRGLVVRRTSERGLEAPEVFEGAPDVGRHPGWASGLRTRRDDDDLIDERTSIVLGIRDGISPNASAVTANADGTRVTVGFADGTVARWGVEGSHFAFDHARPAHRYPISAACQLPSGDEITADRGGWLHRWRGGELVDEWQLEQAYSPRTLAADPVTGRLAVGCKGGRGSFAPGGVAIVDVA